MVTTVWQRVYGNGNVMSLHATRDDAVNVGTANAHAYREPVEVERDVVFIIWKEDRSYDEEIAAVTDTVQAAQDYIAKHAEKYVDFRIDVHELTR